MTKYILTIHDTGSPDDTGISVPFASEDSTLDIATRVIAALNKRKRGPRKGSTRTPTGDGK